MSYTYTAPDGRELPVPEITEYLVDYLNNVFGMEIYSNATTVEKLHVAHGMRKVVDHLSSIQQAQENQKE